MPEFWRSPAITLALLAFISLLLGAIFSATTALLFAVAALLSLLIFHWVHQAALQKWLLKPDPAKVPDGIGRWEEIYADLYRLLKNQRLSQQSLSERLERFREASAAMPDGVVILDGNDRIDWCNPLAEQHFGLDLSKDGGQQITYLVRHPEFAAYLRAQNYREPVIIKGFAGGDTVLSVQLVPYGDAQKLIISRDITRLQRIETMRRDFVANVSHELRTPLTVIGGFLETLSDLEGAEPAVVRRSLQLMSEQTDRMRRLVADLLTLSRLESSNRPPKDDPVNLPLILLSLLTDAQHLSRGRHQITIAECADAWLTGSEDELRSAFANLITNAVRYTPDGGTIQIRWQIVNGEGVFAVTDTGVGIAAEHLPRLTERFYRVDRSRSRETGGTGLGLAIVKHVVSRHQARLQVVSELGKGAIFSVLFPASRIVAPQASSERAQA